MILKFSILMNIVTNIYTLKLKQIVKATLFIASILLPVLILQLFYTNDQINESNYVPKSKRGHIYKMKSKIVSLCKGIWTKIEHHAENMETEKLSCPRYEKMHQEQVKLSTKRRPRLPFIVILSLLAIQAKHTHYELKVNFDTDSFSIGVDSRASACISCEIEDFVGPLVDSTRIIKGFMGNRTLTVKKGTILWR